MFGYIQTDKGELRIREYNAYRGFYCGLCHTLRKEYGGLAKFLLNYDCAFCALILSLPNGLDRTNLSYARCPAKPIGRKEPHIKPRPELDFAAALNVILAYYSIEDKWRDDKNLFALLGLCLYRRAHNKAARKYPVIEIAVTKGLCELHELEKANACDIDAAANASAHMISEAVCSFDFTDETEKHIMSVEVYNLGRWIYIADAWNDRKKDSLKHNYNPVNLQGLSIDEVGRLMYTALCNAKDAHDLLTKNSPEFEPIAENVLCSGCAKVTESILHDNYKTRAKHNLTEEQ